VNSVQLGKECEEGLPLTHTVVIVIIVNSGSCRGFQKRHSFLSSAKQASGLVLAASQPSSLRGRYLAQGFVALVGLVTDIHTLRYYSALMPELAIMTRHMQLGTYVALPGNGDGQGWRAPAVYH